MARSRRKLNSYVWLAILAGLACNAQAQAEEVASQVEQSSQAAGVAEAATNQAETEPPAATESEHSLSSVLEGMQSFLEQSLARLAKRETRYQERLQESEQQLARAQSKMANLESEGRRLDQHFEDNRVELDDKAQLLKEKIGALKELFGVFQQNASDLIGAFVISPTSIQYPDRDKWLEGFAERMKDASEVSSTEDIRVLWYEIMREIAATEDIVWLRAPVLNPETEEASERDFVRVGTFNLVSSEPGPAYLVWKPGKQQVAELPRQPEGPYGDEIEDFLAAEEGLHTFSADPTAGVLLSLLIEKPTTDERVDQGGLVGYLILALGLIALALAAFKLVDISRISLGVRQQQANPGSPREGNPLGRLLQVYRNNQHVDAETLEMRLHDRVRKEDAFINRFTVFLAIIAAVAPLMGLLGTVVGMINTFQAITLYGTGDPQTMAGGISQALITTVLGLIVAVPAVLLHAVVSGRGKAVVNLLKQQSAALTGDSLQAQHSTEGAAS